MTLFRSTQLHLQSLIETRAGVDCNTTTCREIGEGASWPSLAVSALFFSFFSLSSLSLLSFLFSLSVFFSPSLFSIAPSELLSLSELVPLPPFPTQIPYLAVAFHSFDTMKHMRQYLRHCV